jgi:hypothetical protein
VADVERPSTPASARILGVVVLIVAAMLVFGLGLSAVKAVVALFGYIVVAIIAFFVGRFVGRHHDAE